MRFRFIAFLFVVACLTWSCQTKQEMASNSVDLNEVPDQEGWNSTLISTSKGLVASKINYSYMQKFSKKGIIKFLDGVEFELFDDQGKQVSNIHADAGIMSENTNNLDLTGNVIVRSHDNGQLFTKALKWNQNTDKITSNEMVMVVTAENDTIFGKGFESERSLKNWTIKAPSGITQKRLNLDIEEGNETK